MYPEEEKAGIKSRLSGWDLGWAFLAIVIVVLCRRTFHSKYCFYIRVGEGDVNFSVGNMGRDRIPKDHFLLPLDIWCLVWKERISGCPSLYARHSGAWCFYMRADFMTRRNIRNQATKVTTCSRENNYVFMVLGERELHLPNVVYR